MAKKSNRTREARQRRQRQRRQNRWSLLLVAIVIVAIVAMAMIIVSNQQVEAYIPSDLSERYDGITQSFSVEGYPQLGDLDAPVTLDEYASFACPGCEALHSDSFEAILDTVRAGQALYTFVPMQTGSIPNAQGAARAALCAGRQGKFWEMHDVLFDWQTRYANTAYSQNRLLAGAEGLGLNTATLTNCFNSAAISATLTSAMAEDVTGTPTVQVNGVTITSERAGGVPATSEIIKAIDDATPKDWGMPTEPPEDLTAEMDAEMDDAETGGAPAPDAEQDAETDSQSPAAEAVAEQESAASSGAQQSEADDESADSAEDNSPEESDNAAKSNLNDSATDAAHENVDATDENADATVAMEATEATVTANESVQAPAPQQAAEATEISDA